MTKLYLAAGIGRPEQCSRAFSAASRWNRFSSATNDLALRETIGPRAGRFRHRQNRAACSSSRATTICSPRSPELVCRKFRTLELLLVGDGEWRGDLKIWSASARPGRQGHFHRPRPARRSSALRRHHGLPRASVVARRLVRARCRRRSPPANRSSPTISTARDEVCLEGETGFLVRTGDLTAVAKRLLQLAGDAALREKLGRAGRTFVRENFAVEKMVDDHLQSLSETGARRSSSFSRSSPRTG